jgi:hypothetical protein
VRSEGPFGSASDSSSGEHQLHDGLQLCGPLRQASDGRLLVSKPIVFISRHRVKQEKLDEFDTFFRERVPVIDYGDAGTVALLSYLSADGRELHIVHLFPHADAFDAHLQGAAQRDLLAGDFLDGLAWEIYGAAHQETLARLQRRAAAAGIGLTVYPDNFGGYLRAVLD